MDAQMAPAHGNNYEEAPHGMGLHSGIEEGEHHEKMSVMKKVKAKAKKIKDTLGLKMHGHDHDEEEEEDDKVDQVPEVRGAQIYESRPIVAATQDSPRQPRAGLGPVGQLSPSEKEPHAPKDPFETSDPGNYQAKDTDPTGAGGEETGGVAPIVSSFGKMEATVEPEPEPWSSTGSHDQLSPDSPSTKTSTIQDNPQPIPHSFSASKPEGQSQAMEVEEKTNQTTVFGMCSTGGEEAGRVAPIVSSFGNMEATVEPEPEPWSSTGSHDQLSPDSPSTKTSTIQDSPQPIPHSFSASKPEGQSQAMEVEEKTTQTTVPGMCSTGGEEAGGVAPIVSSFGKMEVTVEPEPEPEPLSSTGSHDQLSPDSPSTKTSTIQDNPQPIPHSFSASKPEGQSQAMEVEEKTNQTTYTEKISSAASAIADKAASAKNTVASKLGYGKSNESEMPEGGASAGEHGRKIPATVTEKLAPVYDKAAEAGSAVVSKGPGTGKEGAVGRGADKGVSVKEYWAEKLRPGDEDRALSEVISEALHKPTEEAGKAAHPPGKVTESPEVASRLGSDDKNSGNESPGKGMVDRFKGAVTSWFGKDGEQRTSQASHSPEGDYRGDQRAFPN